MRGKTLAYERLRVASTCLGLLWAFPWSSQSAVIEEKGVCCSSMTAFSTLRCSIGSMPDARARRAFACRVLASASETSG